jgi:hypothetical protein
MIYRELNVFFVTFVDIRATDRTYVLFPEPWFEAFQVENVAALRAHYSILSGFKLTETNGADPSLKNLFW